MNAKKSHKCTMRDEKQNLLIYLYYYAKTHEQKKLKITSVWKKITFLYHFTNQKLKSNSNLHFCLLKDNKKHNMLSALHHSACRGRPSSRWLLEPRPSRARVGHRPSVVAVGQDRHQGHRTSERRPARWGRIGIAPVSLLQRIQRWRKIRNDGNDYLREEWLVQIFVK